MPGASAEDCNRMGFAETGLGQILELCGRSHHNVDVICARTRCSGVASTGRDMTCVAVAGT